MIPFIIAVPLAFYFQHCLLKSVRHWFLKGLVVFLTAMSVFDVLFVTPGFLDVKVKHFYIFDYLTLTTREAKKIETFDEFKEDLKDRAGDVKALLDAMNPLTYIPAPW